MYAWLWRALPFDARGKLAVCGLLVVLVVALLWFVVFPIVEPLMPFNNVQMPASEQSPVPVDPAVGSSPSGR